MLIFVVKIFLCQVLNGNAVKSIAMTSGLLMEVVSLQRSKSMVPALLGHDQVVFKEEAVSE